MGGESAKLRPAACGRWGFSGGRRAPAVRASPFGPISAFSLPLPVTVLPAKQPKSSLICVPVPSPICVPAPPPGADPRANLAAFWGQVCHPRAMQAGGRRTYCGAPAPSGRWGGGRGHRACAQVGGEGPWNLATQVNFPHPGLQLSCGR